MLFVVAGLVTLHNDHFWGDDWAQYLSHASNIAAGKPYANTGYLYNPHNPGVGPAVSQPGLPVLLAPIVAIFGINLLVLKAFEFFLLCTGVALAAMVLTKSFGARIGLLAVALFALHPDVLWLRQVIMTEPPYILFSFASILLARHRWQKAGAMHIVGFAALTGLAVVAAFSMRIVAVALLAAIVVNDLAQRRPLATGTLPVVAVFGAGFILMRKVAAVADYTGQASTFSAVRSEVVPTLADLWLRICRIVEVLGELVPQPFHLGTIAALLLLLLATIGLFSWRQFAPGTPASPAHGGIPAWLAALPLEVWYLGSYLALLVFLPVFLEVRLVLPILPILFALVVAGTWVLLQRAGRHRPTITRWLLAGLALYVVGLQVHATSGALRLQADYGEGPNGAFCDDCKDMYAFLREQTPAAARIAFIKPRALGFLANRKSWVWSAFNSEAEVWASMRNTNIAYLVVPRSDYILAREYPDFLSWPALATRAGVSLAYSNATFRIYQLAGA